MDLLLKKEELTELSETQLAAINGGAGCASLRTVATGQGSNLLKEAMIVAVIGGAGKG